MAVRDCLFDLTLLIEQRNNILTVHVGLTDNGINNILSVLPRHADELWNRAKQSKKWNF